MLNFRRAREKVAGFRSRNRVLRHPLDVHFGVHAVLLELRTGRFIVQVDRLESVEKVAGELNPDEARVEWSPRAEPMSVRGGARAKARRIAEGGTAGWSFILDKDPVCMTAYHVVSSGVERRVSARQCILGPYDKANATLRAGTPWNRRTKNMWDLAIVEYYNINDLIPQMEPCDGGSSPYPYPLELADDLRDDAVCWTVGQGGARCSESAVTRLGDVKVDAGGVSYEFTSVLGFDESFLEKGDSGSIAVYKDDHKVAGLMFAEVLIPDAKLPVYAIPLFGAWKPVGFVTTANGNIPAFVSNGEKKYLPQAPV